MNFLRNICSPKILLVQNFGHFEGLLMMTPRVLSLFQSGILNDYEDIARRQFHSLCVASPTVSAVNQVSLLRKHKGHSPGYLFSLSLLYTVNGWSTLSLSRDGQPVQQWKLSCNFLNAQSQGACFGNNFQFKSIVHYMATFTQGKE